MSASASRNEGFRILDEFVCQAIPAADIDRGASPARGKNEGIGLGMNLDLESTEGGLSNEHRSSLSNLSSLELLALVQKRGAEMAVDQLKFITQLALDRIGDRDRPSLVGTKELLASTAQQLCKLA